ncbi:MAG: hypothetical protein AB1757_21400 [Acidobacteriota bacterium]
MSTEKDYLTIRLLKTTIKRLNDNAAHFKRRSGREIASEIIEQYLPLWERLEQEKTQEAEKRQNELLEYMYTRGQASAKDVEKVKADVQSRKSKKR